MKLLLIGFVICFSFLTVWGRNNMPNGKDIADSSQFISNYPKIGLDENLTWHKMFTNIPNDYYELFGSNNGFGKTFPLLKTILFTGGLLPIDRKTYEFQKAAQSRCFSLREISDYSVFMGDGKFHLIAAGLFSVYGFASNDNRALKTSSNIVESIIATGLIVQVLKRVFGRESPVAASAHSGKWNIFPNLRDYQKNQPRYYAFPSGHIATLTTTFTVIANNYPEVAWIKPLGYSTIGLVGISLVNKGMHWYSDLPLGIYLGYTIGNIIAPEKKSAYDSEKSNLLVYPVMMADNKAGLGIFYNF